MTGDEAGVNSVLTSLENGFASPRREMTTNPPRKYSTNRANQSMPYAWRPGGIFADLILLRKQSCVVLP